MRFLVLLILLLGTPTCFASNRLYADNSLQPNDGFSWDWTFGTGYYYEDPYLIGFDNQNNGIELNLNIALSYDRFYLDFDRSQLTGGLIIGYNVVENEKWALDLIGLNIQSSIDEYGTDTFSGDLIPELEGITTRKGDFNTGLRLSRINGDTLLSFELLHDVSGNHGSPIVNLFISHIEPWRNWEFRSAFGISYFSHAYATYYFGVSESEARPERPVYRGDDTLALQFEFHSEYPLSQHWTFLSGVLTTWFTEGISESPLVKQSHQLKAKVGIRYVF
jgi:outer membrane scaffolding protein for murein synthesis (MipA/OmpV family)